MPSNQPQGSQRPSHTITGITMVPVQMIASQPLFVQQDPQGQFRPLSPPQYQNESIRPLSPTIIRAESPTNPALQYQFYSQPQQYIPVMHQP